MSTHTHSFSVRWGAVVAGLLCALALQTALGLFTSAVAWRLLVTIASPLAGAFLAARLSGARTQGESLLCGLLVWSLMIVVSSLFLLGIFAPSVILGEAGVMGTADGALGVLMGVTGVLSLIAALFGALWASGHTPTLRRQRGQDTHRMEERHKERSPEPKETPPISRYYEDDERPPTLH